MALPILTAQNLHMAFTEGVPVLEDISLDLYPGKLLSIVGPSGSGKTTLLRLLSGLLSPVSGSITLEGNPLEGPNIRLVPGYEEIKLVEQQSALRPNITAEESLRVALLGFKKEYIETRLDYLLDLFFLQDYRTFYPRQLSGGQQQRLTIACAMATEPAVLLMDEPFSALDPANTAILIKNIQKMASQTKTTIVLVTHDTRYALMADEVVVLIHGKNIQRATPTVIYRSPVTKEVASFFGPVSLLSPALKKELGVIHPGKVLVRAESIRVKRRGVGFAGSVTGHAFMGLYDLIEIKLDQGDRLLALDFSRQWQKGEKLVITVPNRKLILLPNSK